MRNYKVILEHLLSNLLNTYPDMSKDDIKVTFTKDYKFGHFTTNLGMVYFRKSGEKDKEEIRISTTKLMKTMSRLLGNCHSETTPNSYINITLPDHTMSDYLSNLVNNVNFFELKQKLPTLYNLEYVSANPTGPLLVANGRAAAIGDTLANLLESQGHKVIRSYYVNDAGSQVVKLGKSILRENRDTYRELGIDIPERIYKLGDLDGDGSGYATETIKEVAEHSLDFYKKKGDVKYYLCKDTARAVKFIRVEQQKTLERFGTKFDEVITESSRSYHPPNEGNFYPVNDRSYYLILDNFVIPEVINKLPGTLTSLINELGELVYTRDGAKWLRTTKFGDDKDRVIVRSNGKATYLLTDIIHHFRKALGTRPDYSEENKVRNVEVLNIWGNDHHGHVLPVEETTKELIRKFQSERKDTKNSLYSDFVYNNYTFRTLLTGWVTLKRGKEKLSMSKREGNLVTLDDLIKKVGVDVARYMFVDRSMNTDMEFDLELASKQTMENPVYYIQYAHARINSLINKAKEEYGNGNAIKLPHDFDSLLTDDNKEEQSKLLRELIYYPQVLKEAADNKAPQKIPHYLYGLAKLFHQYYKKSRIITEDKDSSLKRLGLIIGVQKVIKHGLSLLQISAPESM